MDATRTEARAQVPAALDRALDAAARMDGDTRSGAIRSLLVEALMRRGLWPPRVDDGPDGLTVIR